MELTSTNSKYSFDSKPRFKSSPMPILFIPFHDTMYFCNYCKSKYFRTSTGQLYCKNCLFDYVKNLTDSNTYLDVHLRTEKTQCIEHEPRNLDICTQNIQEWCKNCSRITHFDRIVTMYNYDLNTREPFFYKVKKYFREIDYYNMQERITKCKLCAYEPYTASRLCPNYYLISSEWIESTLDKKPISILYLPWWDASCRCVACWVRLRFAYDYQKWCPSCFIIYTGCRYCLTTNVIFGITEQSKCRNCKRVTTIDITNIDYNLKDFLINHQRIVNYMNNINEKSNLIELVRNFIELIVKDKYFYPIQTNGPIRFISFNNNIDTCYYCGSRYSSTLIFEQKYCTYCLCLYFKDLPINNVCLDLYIINTSNTWCTEHESRNFDVCTQNNQEWCMNCSEVLYFKQTITKYSLDINYYYEKQNKVIKFEKDSKLQFSLNNIEVGWIELALAERAIPILYLPWWYSNEQCIVCKHILNDIFIPFSKKPHSETSEDCQKWCSNCFTIYTGCRYCLTTNIIFGLTDQSKCKKCENISFITIDSENIMENFIVSTRINANNHNQIINYFNSNKCSSLLKIYNFISKLNYIDLKYILYSNLENNENFSIPIIFIPYNHNEELCHYCGNKYSVTLLFKQKYCKYCLIWYIKFTNFTANNKLLDVDIITRKTQCTEHEPRNLDFYTQNIQEWCIDCSEILYFKQIITQYSFDMEKQSKIIQSTSCNLCGNLIYQVISLMCLNCYSVSSGYIKSTLTKKNIPILYLPWWDTLSNCITCRQNLEYKSDYQKWCSYCFITYIGCKYCLTTNIIFGFTNQSQCIKCKRMSFIIINENYIVTEFINSMVDINNRIIKYIKNVDKDKNPLKIYSFINDKLENIMNINMIEYSETGEFKKIAKGGFGIIYKATWIETVVAVKRFMNSQNISKDFVNELKSFNQYHNKFEHVIKYYGITQDPNSKNYMIIMQYANGGDLHNYLQRNFTTITWKDKLTILLDISRGLGCIHKENFIHRDLHSGNILLEIKPYNYNTDTYKWYIGDLGLSQPANITSSNNEIYGVIPYIAPEVFNGKAFSRESDIYSMGMIMWELTTGCKPFVDISHNTDLIIKIIDGKRPEITNDTPKCFANLIKECWNPDPSKRPHVEEIRKTIIWWTHMMKDIDQFKKAEKIRLELIKKKKLGPGSINSNGTLNSKSSSISSSSPTSLNTTQGIYHGPINHNRSLNSKSSSISLSSTTSFNRTQGYMSKDLGFDIDDTQRLNTQHPNAIFTSRLLNESISTVNSSRKRKIEVDSQNNGKLIKVTPV